jgi:hypothetical protein
MRLMLRARGRRASISIRNLSYRAITEAIYKLEEYVYFIYNVVHVY